MKYKKGKRIQWLNNIKDISRRNNNWIKNEEGEIAGNEEDVKKIWKNHF